MKQVHSLAIDNLYEATYTLISIHTSLEDYKLVYRINNATKSLFSRVEKTVTCKHKNYHSFFTLFEFNNPEEAIFWSLVANKCHTTLETTLKKRTLFQMTDEMNRITTYLIPERKKVDYFFKIEGAITTCYLAEIVAAIKKIPKVITSYVEDITLLKSKDFLIF